MTVLLPNGKQFYADNAGSPLAGGKVYTYQAGTNVPAPTWPDAAKSVANTNPVILDARGEAPIFWEGVYKVTLKDALNNLIWTIDNISSTDPLVASLAALSAPTGSALVGYNAGGSGAVTRNVQVKLREVAMSITDFGGAPGLGVDNTAAFNAALVAMGDNYGTLNFPGSGNWRGNFVSNQHNVRLRGCGGVGELNAKACLRPWDVTKPTVRIGNQTAYVRKNSLQDIVISGDDGAGNMAPAALRLDGGCVNFTANNIDLMDGLHSLWIEGGSGFPVSGVFLDQWFARKDYNNAASSNIYIRKYADAVGYVTDIHLGEFHTNTTAAGSMMLLDGTGSTGLVVHMSHGYSDVAGPAGVVAIKFLGGLEVIECDFWQIDMGAPASIMITRPDLVGDPTRFIRGTLEGVGGQLIRLSDLSTIPYPDEPGLVSYEPLFRQAKIIGPTTLTDVTDPYNTKGNNLPTLDKTGAGAWELKNALGRQLTTINGSSMLDGQKSELIVLSTVGVQTLSVANLLPQDSVITGVTARVVAAITGATVWKLGDAVTSGRFSAFNASVAAGSTNIGTVCADQTGAAGPRQAANAKLAITTDVAATAGSIRVTVFYRQFVAPTS